jgi:hypothetical protein
MDRTLFWGAADDAATEYRTRDSDPTGGGNFVVAERADGSSILLQWDDTAGEWVVGGPVNLNGNALTDAAGVEHAGELADASDVSPLQASSDVDHDATANRTHSGDALTPSSVDADSYSVASSPALIDVAASGSVSLSSGTATVDTGLSATDATFYLALGIDDPGADADVAGKLLFDSSAGTYQVVIEEVNSSQNPTVNYDILRVR